VLPSGAVTVAVRNGALGTGCVLGDGGTELDADAVAGAAPVGGGVAVPTGAVASAVGAGKSALFPLLPAGAEPTCPAPSVDVVQAASVTSAPASASHRVERMRTA